VDVDATVSLPIHGFRAEKAKISAVVTRNRRVTTACARAGIAVYRRRRDLLRDYPPEDLSSLLGDDQAPEPRATVPPAPSPSPNGFDGLVLLAVWGRVALIATALVALLTASTLITAIVAQVAAIGLIAARLRH
jgi:hypothetical protein